MTLGQKIRNRRRELGLTQEELAAKAHLSQLEKGTFDPTAPMIARLAVSLEVSADELLGINDTKKQAETNVSEPLYVNSGIPSGRNTQQLPTNETTRSRQHGTRVKQAEKI